MKFPPKRREKNVNKIFSLTVIVFIISMIVVAWSFCNIYLAFERASELLDQDTYISQILERQNSLIEENNDLRDNVPVREDEEKSQGENTPDNQDDASTNTDREVVYGTVYAYCLKGRMANGQWVMEGAVANNKYPFGTKVRIGDNTYIVQDRMAETHIDTHWDIYMEDCQEAIQHGVKYLPITILE